MISRVEDYLVELRQALAGADPASRQDAESDAEEYLRDALETAHRDNPGVSDAEGLQEIIKKYGSPQEVAAAYRDSERRMPPYLAPAKQQNRQNVLSSFFGVLADPRAWGALLYMFLSLGTGIAYFTWAVTGLSLSFGLLILIIGLPFAVLFILSVRGIAILEGRLVEALLGVRMPRRPPFQEKTTGMLAKLKVLLVDRYTWFSLLYMILQLGFGIAYFTVFTVLLSVSAWLIAQPVLEPVFHLPAFVGINNSEYFLNNWLLALSVIAGVLLFFGTMHLARLTGRLHGKWAKLMLVRL
jgi:uncharacterized membrane protein